MPPPRNKFKAAIAAGQEQIGCWLSIPSAYTAEMVGTAGYDWVLIDGEHAPNDLNAMIASMQALESSDASVLVRLPVGETWMIKQILDAGAQTVLIPMVETSEEAVALVRATRYPPNGIRGVGPTFARASKFSGIADYLHTAESEICLLVQVETQRGLDNIEAIGAVDGIDGLFIGPADLSADLGFMGEMNAPEVQAAIKDALGRIRATGKAAGILTMDQSQGKAYAGMGANFIAMASDVLMLVSSARAKVADWRG